MKSKLIAVLLVVMLAVAGCSSSGSKPTDSGDKVATINSLMSKGYEMSKNQRETINQLTADGKKLASQGKTAQADKLFDEAIKLLEVIAETDRFNKSE
jgi:ABC-type glycerol-3-phosphate transport system substrate-binding protein